jgi:murein DD-endopeptidase MepM/ murein hydrolase activator NlpD
MPGRLARPSNDTEANKAFGVGGHHGTDWGWGQGDAVYAMADGVVVDVRTLTDYGKIIIIDHGPIIKGVTQTRYCHLSRQDVAVGTALKPTRVKRGQQIGVMGNTGSLIPVINGVKSKHLHSELWLDGVRVDEQPYQKENYTVAPNTRTVGATNSKRRTGPTIPKTGEPDNLYPDLLTFNTPMLVTGYRTDLDPTHFIISETCPAPGSNKWFLVDDAEDGGNVLWSHSSTFTDPSVNGITSLDPVIPPSSSSSVTKADLLATEKKILDAIAAIPKPPTEVSIATEVIKQIAN